MLGRAPAVDWLVGPGDDAAVQAPGLVLTKDLLVEGVHWDARSTPESVGYKALAVSVSDVLAMGAEPTWALVGLALPRPHDPAWITAFAHGLGQACRVYGVALAGGDTVRASGGAVVSVTLAGRLLAPSPWRRQRGQPGDVLLVTGWPGLATLGLDENGPDAAWEALTRPRPPLAWVRRVAPRAAVTSAMDLSDGLAADLPRLCGAGLGAVVDCEHLPVHPALQGRPDAVERVLRGGDDYQLLVSAPAGEVAALQAAATETGTPLHRLGQLTAGGGLRRSDGRPWPAPAFLHFGGSL